jgi:cell wall-associated NlpC family hydrolase
MFLRSSLLAIVLVCPALAAEPDRATYRSPYKVNFTFRDEELFGDLVKGPRADWKQQASIPFRDWYGDTVKSRWHTWGPPQREYDAPPGLASRDVEWARQRVIAAGLRLVGYSYQHHHVPDWEPPADWPESKIAKARGKGLDCSNFTTWAYNHALGYRPNSEVKGQSELTETPGPGANRTTPMQRIELPARHEDFERTLRTGDLLFVKNNAGEVSHVVLWVGKIGHSRDGTPLILDSTGTGSKDSEGNAIPDGIYLRPFRPTSWYAKSASHALRILPDRNGGSGRAGSLKVP